jgi:hypothetical protein
MINRLRFLLDVFTTEYHNKRIKLVLNLTTCVVAEDWLGGGGDASSPITLSPLDLSEPALKVRNYVIKMEDNEGRNLGH